MKLTDEAKSYYQLACAERYKDIEKWFNPEMERVRADFVRRGFGQSGVLNQALINTILERWQRMVNVRVECWLETYQQYEIRLEPADVDDFVNQLASARKSILTSIKHHVGGDASARTLNELDQINRSARTTLLLNLKKSELRLKKDMKEKETVITPQQLENAALDPSVSITDLLRRALGVARRLKDKEFEEWIQVELKGYEDLGKVPKYRTLSGTPIAFVQGRGWEDVLTYNLPVETTKKISTFYMYFPIETIEADVNNSAKADYFSVTYETKAENNLIRAMNIPRKPGVRISRSQFQGILDAVRHNVLDWCHKLEAISLAPVPAERDVEPAKKPIFISTLLTFFGVYGGTWVVLEPLFAVFGGEGPLASLGKWRFLILVIWSLIITIVVEIVKRRK